MRVACAVSQSSVAQLTHVDQLAKTPHDSLLCAAHGLLLQISAEHAAETSSSMGDFFYTNIAPLLYYTTPKRVKIKYWQLGAVHLALSGLLFAFYLQGIINSGDYLLREQVIGTASPFASASTHPSVSCEAAGNCATTLAQLSNRPYCQSLSHNFIYSEEFAYRDAPGSNAGPVCREVAKDEISKKRANYLSFSTVFTETHTFAWPCDEANSSFALNAISNCDAGSTTVDPAYPTQCFCTLQTAVFPTALEDYTVHLTHSYDVQVRAAALAA